MALKPFIEKLISKISSTDIENRVVVTHRIDISNHITPNSLQLHIEPASSKKPIEKLIHVCVYGVS